MRTIKFRLWDKGLKKMSYSPLHAISFEGKLQYGNADFSDYGAEIMQFTGLKDKNQKEIYEGDIVSFPDTETEQVDVGVGMIPVAQTELNAWGIVKKKNYSWGLDIEMETEVIEKGFNSFNEIDQNLGYEELEIIGNIYENPELLTNK